MSDSSLEPKVVAAPPLTADEQRVRRQAIREMFPRTPFMGSMGVTVERYEPDEVTMRLPFRDDLTNDGVAYHGGVIASLMDSAGGLAAWSGHDFDKGIRAATVSINIQYVGAATPRSDLWCSAAAVKRGRELIFCEMRVLDVADRLLAHGMLTYRIV